MDISKLTPDALASLNADLWLLSPACQPYTVLNPNAKGAEDPRAQSFLHLVKSVLPDLAASDKHPRRLLVENVAGFEVSLTSFQVRESFLTPFVKCRSPVLVRFYCLHFNQSAIQHSNFCLLPFNLEFPTPVYGITS